jgi:tRNA(fMet)-specific endonuclease VapC
VAEPRYLLDANICIYILEGSSDVLLNKVGSVAADDLAISAIVQAEVALGLALTGQGELAERFFDKFAILPFDSEAAKAYARLPFRRASFDRLIAAHALSCGAILITNNERDFADIAGLETENWTR